MEQKDISKIISENLKRLMEEENISNVELSKIIGVSESTVGKWILQKSIPRMGAIEKLARFFGVNKSDILEKRKSQESNFTIQEYRLCPSIAHAGTTDYNENEYYEPQYIKLPDELLGKYAGRKDIEFCKINGDSMNNIFLGHTIIGYLTDSNYYTLKAGDIVIFRYGTDLGVKRYYDIGDEIMFKADSHHPDFQDKEYRYPKDEYLQIIGKVVVYNVIM